MKKILLVILVLSSTSAFSALWGNKSPEIKKSIKPIASPVRVLYELAVCSINNQVKKNPTYYQLASVNTKLVCDVGANNTSTGTFRAFYNNGWRLIQIVNIDNRLVTENKSVPYALIYLERVKP